MKVIFFSGSSEGGIKTQTQLYQSLWEQFKKRSEANQKTRAKNSSGLQQEDERV